MEDEQVTSNNIQRKRGQNIPQGVGNQSLKTIGINQILIYNLEI